MTSPMSKSGSGLNDLLIYQSSLESNATSKGYHYPAKVAFSLGMGKLLVGLLLLVFGVLALLQGSSQAYLGGGLWGGVCVIVSGIFGTLSSRRPCTYFYLASFMSMSIVSLAVSGLVVIFSSIGLIRDDARSRAVFVESETGEPLAFLGDVLIRRPAVVFSAVLLALSILDMLLSLFAIAICSREVCASKPGARLRSIPGLGGTDRLWRWLGQQRNRDVYVQQVPPPPSSRLTSLHGWVPMPPPGVATVASPVYPTLAPSIYPRPVTAGSAVGPGLHGSEFSATLVNAPRQEPPAASNVRRKRRERRKKRRPEPSGPTDAEIESSYTGLDREIAEEFITVSMEPGLSQQREARLHEVSDSLHSTL